MRDLSGPPRSCQRRSGAGELRTSRGSKKPHVGDGAVRQEPDVQVDEGDGEQGVPGVAAMAAVELADEGPGAVPDRVLGEVPQPAAEDVPAGVARQRVEPDEGD